MKSKITAAIITASLLMPYTAQAAQWIELSAWSYNTVSSFVAEGLLPESMEDITDYKRTINRGEFCTLLYSVLKKSGMITNERDHILFKDCENQYKDANNLAIAIDLLSFDVEGSFEERGILKPEEPVTRLWAAGIIKNILFGMGIYNYDSELSPETVSRMKSELADYDEIKNYKAVGFVFESGIMTDMDDGCFHAEREMSIEQAVSVIYRMYKLIPRVVTADNEGEETSRAIGAGLTEDITKDYYNIKSGETDIISLEADVYSKILAADYNGKKLIFAVNFNDKTDVFDVRTKELLYTIPYIVNEVDGANGYAYTLSGRFMPYYTGLYSMENKELLKPEYSRAEVNEIAANNMELPKEEYRAPDGWIYYADWNDKGHMYRVDSNGENKQLITDSYDCTNLQYVNGKIYFNDNEKWGFHSVKPDGEELTDISGSNSYLHWSYKMAMYPYTSDENYVWGKEELGFYEFSSHLWSDNESSDADRYGGIYNDGSILYHKRYENTLKRKLNDDATMTRDAYKLYRCTPDGKSVPLADFYININESISANNGDGKIYFQNGQELFETGESPIYLNNNGELKCISGDYKAACFGFGYNHDTSRIDTSKLAFITQEEVLKGTYHELDLATGKITVRQLMQEPPFEHEDENGKYLYRGIGNDDVEVWRYNGELYIKADGNEVCLGTGVPVSIIGDILYYQSNRSVYFITSSFRLSDSGILMGINHKTGEIYKIDDAYDHLIYHSAYREFPIYKTALGELRHVTDDCSAVTLFPNKGIHRCGKVNKILHMPKFIGQKDCLYKLDTDGNITQLTYTDSQNALYIPSDGSTAVSVRD